MSSTATNNRSFFSDFKRFMPLLKNLVSKDFKIKYRRSVLGVAWSVLNPLLTMIVLTKVFEMLLRDSVPDFATYYIVGSALWNFFSEATSCSLSSILTSGALIRKVYIPKYIFPLEKCVFALINFVFSFAAAIVVALIQNHTLISWRTLLFPIPVLYCFIFVCGLSLFLSAVTVYFRDVQHLYGVLLTMWVYLTPMLYPISLLDGFPLIQKVVMLNPMTHYVEFFRDVVMRNTFPSLKENLLCIAVSLISLGLGALVFKKAEGKFILHL